MSTTWRACYAALGVIHGAYHVLPGRFKDYISTPKPNGYRSLHTTIIGPERRKIEVQIRTRDMNEVSELGVAAHWPYKQDTPRRHRGPAYRWIRELLDILEHAAGPEEFLENTKLEMFQDQVFCFTPKGDLIALPRGATPVDFAYAVHSAGRRPLRRRQDRRPHGAAAASSCRTATRSRSSPAKRHAVAASGNGSSSPARRVRGSGAIVRLRQREDHLRRGRDLLTKAARQEQVAFPTSSSNACWARCTRSRSTIC